MGKTLGTPTDVNKWTLSLWVKPRGLGVAHYMVDLTSGSGNFTALKFDSDNTLLFGNYDGGYAGQLVTNRKFSDVASWYHLVAVWDSDNGTAGNRMRLYVNGVEETSFSTDTKPSSGEAAQSASGADIWIAAHQETADYYSGYMAEVCFIDGLALTPTSFGEFDEDSPTIWKPIKVSGLTFGTNGFYLDFKASDNLGNDANGGTDLGEDNLAAANQATDTPTNNFCVMNPLDNYWQGSTFSEGNCIVTTTNAATTFNTGTIGMTTGKWYFEAKITDVGATSNFFGVTGQLATSATNFFGNGTNFAGTRDATGKFWNNNESVTYGATWTSNNDILGIALDLDNNRFYSHVNGTWNNSGDPTDGTGAITIGAASTTPLGAYFASFGDWKTGDTITMAFNFGGCPAFAISSGNADGAGYGNFEYAVPSGYYALCTKNLAEYG